MDHSSPSLYSTNRDQGQYCCAARSRKQIPCDKLKAQPMQSVKVAKFELGCNFHICTYLMPVFAHLLLIQLHCVSQRLELVN